LLSYLRSLLISCSFSYQSDAPHRDLHSFPTRRSSDLVAGGMGARPSLDGMSATHTHMTNSLNTPAEALEYAYPLRVRRYRINQGSGGRGKHKGGDGSIREIEVLAAARMSLLSDRRKRAPYGLRGGEDGKRGRACIIRTDGSEEELTSKGSWQMEA